MMNFFKAIGDFLRKSEDYFDFRIRTGKFPEDIRYIKGVWSRATHRFFVHLAIKINRSPFTIALLNFLLRLHKHFSKYRLYVFGSMIVIDGCRVLFKFYSEIFIIFALTFPSIILLLNFFENSIQLFVFMLLPIIFYNTYCISSLYYCIYQKNLGITTSIWSSLQTQSKRFFLDNYVTAVQITILLIFSVMYFIILLFGGYLFEFFGIDWRDAFYYWFLAIFAGFLFIISSFVITIVMHQTYFYTVLNRISIQKAVSQAWKEVKEHSSYLFFFYVLLLSFFVLLIIRSALSYLHLGIAISSYFFFYFNIFLGFLLWSQIQRTKPQAAKTEMNIPPVSVNSNSSLFFPILLFLGMINYALAAFLVIQNYHTIYSFVQQQQERVMVSQGQARYTNVDYKYTFEYPKDWTIYDWPDGSVTFYHNYTGTVTGGLWLNVNVSQHSEDTFRTLFNHPPGMMSQDEFTNNTAIKVTNILIQRYEGYVYTEVVEKQPYNEYRTNYVIHKGDQDFTLTFSTFANDLGGYDSDIYQNLINSFMFIE